MTTEHPTGGLQPEPDPEPPRPEGACGGELGHGFAVAHAHAVQALDERAPLVVVTWLSAHLATTDRLLHPVVRSTLADGRGRVDALRRTDHVLLDALWRLDRHTTGDVHQGRVDGEVLLEAVRRALAAHVAAEEALLTLLRTALGPEGAGQLEARLNALLPHSPTRPHPEVWRVPGLAGATFRLEALLDRSRDLLDSRVVPTPRVPVTVTPMTRWGRWATAAGHAREAGHLPGPGASA